MKIQVAFYLVISFCIFVKGYSLNSDDYNNHCNRKELIIKAINITSFNKLSDHTDYEIPDWWFNPGKGKVGRNRLNEIGDAEEIWRFLLEVANDKLFQDSVVVLYQPASVMRVKDLIKKIKEGRQYGYSLGGDGGGSNSQYSMPQDGYNIKSLFYHISKLNNYKNFNSDSDEILENIIVDLLWEFVINQFPDPIDDETFSLSHGCILNYLRSHILTPNSVYNNNDNKINELVYTNYKTHMIMLSILGEMTNNRNIFITILKKYMK